MEQIIYRYSNHAWGFNEDEIYFIDLKNKVFKHFTKTVCDDQFEFPDSLVGDIVGYFEPIYNEFPQSSFAFDAPMYELTIDDKKCERIADEASDHLYWELKRIFNNFKS